MEFFKRETRIQFMKQRRFAALFSLMLFIASVAAIWANGLTLGLDFTGGTQVAAAFTSPVDPMTLRKSFRKAGFDEAVIQSYGPKQVSIRVSPHKEWSQKTLRSHIQQVIPNATINQFDYIGPSVGKQLMNNGILAIIVSLLLTMLYIAMRFDYRFAISAAIALIHDPILILGIFAYFKLDFNMIVLTAVLTVIGYSLNDTVVVYDRVRENFRKMRKSTTIAVMDASINQTLSRTIMTSGLTLLVVIALFIYGGATVHGFALALMIGILVGTYSSIYVAGSLAVSLGLTRKSLVPSKKFDDGRP